MSARVMGARARSTESPLWYFDFRTCDTAIDPRITFTRASAKWRFNSAGVLVSVGSGAPAIEFNPATLANRGLAIEDQCANTIRNNSMQGAVAGTPGTLPTNWNVVTDANITQTVVGTGTENGIDYIDLRFAGTPVTSSFINVTSDIAVAGSSGQTWTGSFDAKLVAGSFANTTPSIEIRESTAGNGFLINTIVGITPGATLTRYQATRTLTNGSTALVSVRFISQYTSGLAVDFTIRIGMPQLEQGSWAKSRVRTTGAAVTRIADLPVITGISQTKGTLVVTGEIIGGTASTFPWFAALTSATPNSDAIGITWTANGGVLRGGVAAGGTVTADQPGTANLTAGSAFKAAIAFDTNYSQTAFGGGVISSVDTSVNIPTCDRLYLGGPTRFQNTANYYLQTVALYADVLGSRQLLELTP